MKKACDPTSEVKLDGMYHGKPIPKPELQGVLALAATLLIVVISMIAFFAFEIFEAKSTLTVWIIILVVSAGISYLAADSILCSHQYYLTYGDEE